MSGPENPITPPQAPKGSDVGESRESVEQPRGALFIIWDKKNGKFLLQQRDEQCRYYPHKWCFPGGHKKEGERPIDAALREVFSEYELKFTEQDFSPLLVHQQPHAPGTTQVFVAELPDTQTPVMHEGAAMEWRTLEEIKTLIDTQQFGFGQEAFIDTLEEYVRSHSHT